MKLLIDFSLSSSRDRLNKILTEMRSKVRLELHDAIAVYERKLTKENNGETVVILDAKAMVDFGRHVRKADSRGDRATLLSSCN